MPKLARNSLYLLYLCLSLPVLNACAGPDATRPVTETTPAELRRCAETAYREENLSRGERCYRELLDTDAGTAADWYRLGNIYARTGRGPHAINAYNRALRLDPEMADAWYNLGIVHMRQAVNSFSALQAHAPPDNPLHEKSGGLIQGIVDLINAAPAR